MKGKIYFETQLQSILEKTHKMRRSDIENRKYQIARACRIPFKILWGRKCYFGMFENMGIVVEV